MATQRRPFGGDSLLTLPDCYVAVDAETTGLSFDYDNIIELAAIRVEGGVPVDRFQSFVHLGWPLPQFITELTGITDEMLENAPTEGEAIRAFAKFANDSVLLAHNANFDMTFLYEAYERNLGRPLTNDFVDTLRVARKALPELEHHTAEDVEAAMGVVNEHRHRAIGDVDAESRFYLLMREQLLEKYGEEGYARLFKRRAGKSGGSSRLTAEEVLGTLERDEGNPLFGMRVVFTGALDLLVRSEAQRALETVGGIAEKDITKKTDYLVLGSKGYQKRHQDKPVAKVVKAQQNQLKGLPIQVISEDAFFELLQS